MVLLRLSEWDSKRDSVVCSRRLFSLFRYITECSEIQMITVIALQSHDHVFLVSLSRGPYRVLSAEAS